MTRSKQHKLRINLFVKGFNRKGERILYASRRIPAAFLRVIEASPAVQFMVKIRYGYAKTAFGKKEEIINEIEGAKHDVLKGLRIMLSHPEIDFTEEYWSFI